MVSSTPYQTIRFSLRRVELTGRFGWCPGRQPEQVLQLGAEPALGPAAEMPLRTEPSGEFRLHVLQGKHPP